MDKGTVKIAVYVSNLKAKKLRHRYKFFCTYLVNNVFCSSTLNSIGKATLNSFAYREFDLRSFFSTSFHNYSRLLAHAGAFLGIKIKLSGITDRE